MDEIDTHAKRIKLDEPRAVAIVNQSSVLSDHNTFKQAKIGINSSSLIYCAPGRKAQKRSASHMKTLDTNLDVDHSFDFVRTLSAENIKLQEANVRLREADGKRVHEHACLQKKVKRMERERMQLLNGLEESGFTDAQIEFIKRKGVAETQEDQASASHSLKVVPNHRYNLFLSILEIGSIDNCANMNTYYSNTIHTYRIIIGAVKLLVEQLE